MLQLELDVVLQEGESALELVDLLIEKGIPARLVEESGGLLVRITATPDALTRLQLWHGEERLVNPVGKTLHMDVALRDGETADGLAAKLAADYDVRVTVDAEQACPGGTSMTAVGNKENLDELLAWYQEQAESESARAGTVI